MSALLRVEFLRLRSRRLFRWLTVLALAGFALAGVIVYFTAQSPPFPFFEMDEVILGLTVPFMSLAWLVGASAIGAEWPNRTITSLVTWEPRRTRVLAAKYVATALATAAWLVALCAILTAIMALDAAVVGTFEGVDSAWFLDYLGAVAKLATGGALAATLGLSLATIGKNTAAALGTGFAYLAIVESLIRGFKPSWGDWLLGDNLGAFLFGSADVGIGHSAIAGGLVLLAYAGVLVTAALLTFRRREIA